MPRPKAAATVPRLDPLAEIRQLRARQAALRDDLRAKRDRLLAEVGEIDEALAEMGGAPPTAAPVVVAPYVAPVLAKASTARAVSGAADRRILDELVALRPWIPGLRDHQRKVVSMRLAGKTTVEIAQELGATTKDVSNAIYAGRARLRELRSRSPKGETPASDDEPAPAPGQSVVRRGAPFRGGKVKQLPNGKFRYTFTFEGIEHCGPSVATRQEAERLRVAAAAAVADLHPDALPIALGLVDRDTKPANDAAPASIEVEKQEQPRAPTGWDRSDPDEDFTDLAPAVTPADPAHVHLWSPESGGAPSCTLAYDPAARLADRGETTCPSCLAIPEPAAPAASDQRPPDWVLGWLSPEVRRAYQGVALEGLSCQTMAWSEAVTPNVISGRVNGARQKVNRLMRWEAEREAEGKPLTDKDREAPPAYRNQADPLLAILQRPEAPPADGDDLGPTPTLERARAKLSVLDGRVRARTISAPRLSRAERRAVDELDYPADVERPRTRGDCGPRPCPHCGALVAMRMEVTDDRPNRDAVWKTQRIAAGGIDEEWIDNDPDVARPMRVRDGEGDDRGAPAQGTGDIMRMSHSEARPIRDPGVQRVAGDDQPLHESQGEELSNARSEGNICLRPLAEQLRGVPGRRREAAVAAARARPDEQRRQLRAGKLPLGHAQHPDAEQANIACPNCRGRVRYVGGVDGATWSWEKHDPAAPAPRLAPGDRGGYARALNHCRPCPFSSCSHHLYLDVNPDGGAIKLNFPHLEVDEMAETCTLDVADRGGITLEEVGAILNLTRERIRQVEVGGLSKMQDGHFEDAPEHGWSPLGEAIVGR